MKTCKEIMTTHPKCLAPSDSLQMGASQMRDEDIGSVLICEPESGKLLGIVTDRDIAVKGVAKGVKAEEALETIATWGPICCQESDDMEAAIKRMTDHQVRRLPVTDANGKLVGIISQGDIATRQQETQKTADMVQNVSQPPSTQYKKEHAA
jgi:CBS domain-containing protein